MTKFDANEAYAQTQKSLERITEEPLNRFMDQAFSYIEKTVQSGKYGGTLALYPKDALEWQAVNFLVDKLQSMGYWANAGHNAISDKYLWTKFDPDAGTYYANLWISWNPNDRPKSRGIVLPEGTGRWEAIDRAINLK